MEVVDAVLKEPEIKTAKLYARRVWQLNLIYSVLFLATVSGESILIYKIKILVTFAQRSNVETLTLAFLFILFSYLTLISGKGVWGVCTNLFYCLVGYFTSYQKSELAKQKNLDRLNKSGPISVALNQILRLEGKEDELYFELEVQDRFGSLGRLRFEGARIEHLNAPKDGANSIFPFVIEQLNQFKKLHPESFDRDLDIVEWSKVDDEETEKFLALSTFAQRLERHLGVKNLWPTRFLTKKDFEKLQVEVQKICPALRSEAFLPHWEYSGEHKLPIIPEPLGIISLSRNEKRVDPLASMVSVLVTVSAALCILFYVVFFPPWVPGK